MSLPNASSYNDSLMPYNIRYWLNGIAGSVICAVGLLGNAFNVLIQVKTFQKNRGKPRYAAPTTLFLLVMAVCDTVVLSIYLLYDIVCVARSSRRPLITTEDVQGLEGTFTYFIFFIWYLPTNAFITASNWCIVGVMCFRFVAVYAPLRAKTWCSLMRAQAAVVAVLFLSVLLTVPDYFTVRLQLSNSSTFIFSETELSHNDVFVRIYFALFEAINSFIPFIICSFLSFMLIRTLNKKDANLRECTNRGTKAKNSEARRQRRVSIMLLGITFWFILCTCPSFICRIVTLLTSVQDHVFRGLADFCLLLNHAANFVLYAVTSNVYRRYFIDLLFCRNRRDLERKSTVTLLASERPPPNRQRYLYSAVAEDKGAHVALTALQR